VLIVMMFGFGKGHLIYGSNELEPAGAVAILSLILETYSVSP